MKRGTLYGDDWSRYGMWLESPNIKQFCFQTDDGVTIILNMFARIVLYADGNHSMELRDGRKFELIEEKI